MNRKLIIKCLYFIVAIIISSPVFAEQSDCEAKLQNFIYGGKDYANKYASLPGEYWAYGVVDPSDISSSDIQYSVTSKWVNPMVKRKDKTISLIALGDIIPHADIQVSAAMHNGYQYLFKKIKPTFASADFVVANLETPVMTTQPPSGECFQFNASDKLLVAIKQAGIDALLTANNHSLDQGFQGYIDTVNAIKQHHLMVLGSNITKANPYGGDSVIHVKNIKGFKLGLLNYTFLSNNPNTEHPNLFKFLPNPSTRLSRITQDMSKLKKAGAQYIILFFHWGKGQEYHPYPKKELQTLAHQLILNGADMIIGMHPHVIQPIELVYVKDNKIVTKSTQGAIAHAIVYSLGNFISHQRGLSEYGMLLKFKLAMQNKQILLASLNPSTVTLSMKIKKMVTPEKRTFTYIGYQVKQSPFQTYLNYIKGHPPVPLN